MTEYQIVGCILGTAVGDSIGLPYEGLSRRRGARVLGSPERHRFLFGRGMVSDDTEHTCLVAQSLIATFGDTSAFERSLSWRLRWWLLGVPAGIGLATLKATLRLWLGVSPKRSGVFSAGNGPAMRCGILGAAISDVDALQQYVHATSRLTHTDPKAEYGAFAIALAVHLVTHRESVTPSEYLEELKQSLPGEAAEFIGLIDRVVASVASKQSTEDFALACGFSKGVSGYVYHSVPIAIHAWLSHPKDFEAAIQASVRCGGDTDTVAAMVGGIVGATVGREEIPTEWLSKLCEWPRSVSWMERLGKQLFEVVVSNAARKPIRLHLLPLLLRNFLFLLVVLFHGFRRLAPPY